MIPEDMIYYGLGCIADLLKRDDLEDHEMARWLSLMMKDAILDNGKVIDVCNAVDRTMKYLQDEKETKVCYAPGNIPTCIPEPSRSYTVNVGDMTKDAETSEQDNKSDNELS